MFLDRISKKEKIGIFSAALFLSIALSDRLVVTPISNRVQQIKRQIKISEMKLSRGLRILNQRQFIDGEYQKYIQYVKKVGSDEEEIARVLGEIEELARASAVNLVDIKPQHPKKVDFYKEYTVNLEAEAGMESLVRFLEQLNSSPQLLRAEKLRFKLKKKDASLIKAEMLITKILIPTD